jgi:hypothetical protein
MQRGYFGEDFSAMCPHFGRDRKALELFVSRLINSSSLKKPFPSPKIANA